MGDFNKVREMLKSLITDTATDEQLQLFGKISGEIDNLENQEKEMIQSHEDLRKKYIDAIKDTSFQGRPKEENPAPKSLEECMQEIIDNRQ